MTEATSEEQARPPAAGGRHGSAEFRAVALAGEILRVTVGSGLHGISVSDQDDVDQLGVCVEAAPYVLGLRPFGSPEPGQRFEQYIYRSQAEGVPSGPGDLDLTIYSLRKYVRLALAGNPTILLPLFAPDDAVVTITGLGRELRQLAPALVSRQAGERFTRYLAEQRAAMLSAGGKGRDVTRPDLIARYGWDTKYGAHMIRLGLQGAELMRTGRITLPVPEPHRSMLVAIRTGGAAMSEVLELAAELEEAITAAVPDSPLPAEPDREMADAWLCAAYLRAWWGESSAMRP